MIEIKDLKRGDIVKIGKTQWIVSRVVDNFNAWVYKHPSKHAKLYTLRRTSHEVASAVEVFQTDGCADRLGANLVEGPLTKNGFQSLDP